MTRRFTAGLCMALVALLILFDQAETPLNPYHAPPAFAFGSGQVVTGGFCAALPQ
ncbi:hypothetical protein [Paenirhodobacter populi]|uniref:hypothetical protein n=1 Tax=Paenirhodobacter populi TaxID=2306993 RepID=UPI0013E29689|nr:hypothetical protein [Sinirhodobacter populi]